MTRLGTALARIAELRALAQQATPGPWTGPRVGLLGGTVGASFADAAFIAAWSPTLALAVLDAAEAELRAHRPLAGAFKPCCADCSAAPWPCPPMVRWLAVFAPEEDDRPAVYAPQIGDRVQVSYYGTGVVTRAWPDDGVVEVQYDPGQYDRLDGLPVTWSGSAGLLTAAPEEDSR